MTAFDHRRSPAERGDYWVAVHTWVFDLGLSHVALCTYIALASFADRAGKAWPSIAAIARPQRFFDSLTALGIPLAYTIALPDHAALDRTALPAADYIFVTEKDAAKLPPPPHAPSNIWVLPIDAQITPDLADWVLAELGIQAA